MAISDQNKLDYLWKKVGYGMTKTDAANRKSPSNESIPSPFIVRGDKIWAEADRIPEVRPTSNSEVVNVYLDSNGNSTIECIEDATAQSKRSWKTGLEGWISPEFGPTYQVRVYVGNPGLQWPQADGVRIFPDGTGNDEWFFDYQSGVLHFIGASLPNELTKSGKIIYIAGARYVGNLGISASGSGGEVFATAGDIPSAEVFIADGMSNTFFLAEQPASVEAIDVYVNDVLQRPGPSEVFALQTDQLVFHFIPPAGTDIYVKYRYPFASMVDIPDNAVENRHLKLTYTSTQHTGDGVQTVYTSQPGHNQHSILVIVNGLIVPPNTYTVVGGSVTFVTAPPLDSVIDFRYLPVQPNELCNSTTKVENA